MNGAAPVFSAQDRADIQARGLSEEEVRRQLKVFERGPVYARLLRPCRVGDGVRRFEAAEIEGFRAIYAAAAKSGRAMKFVPASGAGTRMFRQFLAGLHGTMDEALAFELERLPEYPFYAALDEAMARSGFSLQEARERRDYRLVLEFLLGTEGLDYAESPKGLVLFHRYPDGARSAFEEQLAEAAELVRDQGDLCRIHFTLAGRHRESVREHLSLAAARLAASSLRMEIGDSLQEPSTDTIAADEANQPFRDLRGRLVFRPAGHGALLANLQALNGDLVFLKNIDNVSPERLRSRRLDWERVLGGVLVALQSEVFGRLDRLEAGLGAEGLEEISNFLKSNFGTEKPEDWSRWDSREKSGWLFSALHRPLRVAGMVLNQGEPGGAPFWVRDGEGRISAQIVESAQVDPQSPQQLEIFRGATHFNPVNLVCALRDYQGRPFDLHGFVDPEAGFISKKSHEGRSLQALERPGLWNGSMAYWNSVFVEIPIETFSPVKSVEDLLRPEHR